MLASGFSVDPLGTRCALTGWWAAAPADPPRGSIRNAAVQSERCSGKSSQMAVVDVVRSNKVTPQCRWCRARQLYLETQGNLLEMIMSSTFSKHLKKKKKHQCREKHQQQADCCKFALYLSHCD